MVKSINPDNFYKEYQTTPLAIIDVRAAEDYLAGHIPSSQNIPLDELSDQLSALSESTHYYTFCYSGNRSAIAAELLSAHGFNVTNVLGGMNHWPGELTE